MALSPTTIPGTTIRFFISSTFVDFQTERNVLQKHVFPQLRELCAASGFRLQPIDLRWGVSEAAGTDRQTLRICFDELERCRQLSPDCFLLILLGDRYGSYILPPRVQAALIEQLLPHLTAEEQVHFDFAYRLDENAVPPEYVLLRVQGPEQAEDELLRVALVRAGHAAGVEEADRLLFEGSATHREIQLGLLREPLGSEVEQGVLCAVRTFTGSPMGPKTERFAAQDGERAVRVQQLTAAILSRLPEEQVGRYVVPWEDERGPQFDDDALVEAYLALLRPKLEAVITARTAARRAARTEGRDAVALTNAAFAHERAARVEGRAAEQERLQGYLAGARGEGFPMLVTGPAGSGKSTLLADAVARAAAVQPQAAVIARYVGVTPNTGSFVEVLTSLRHAIAKAFDQPNPALLTDENQLVSAVAAELASIAVPSERPLLVVLDALDQLGPHTQRTDWLPPTLAPNVRVVVSVIADRAELGYLRARLPAEQVMTLAPLSEEAGRALLHQQLAAAPARCLTPTQEQAVLAAFAPEGLPLYLRLVASEARRWRSFDLPQVGDSPLPASIPALLNTLLTRLEAPERYGPLLVARSLGNLAAARYGLAEDELLAVLARDDAVRADLKRLSEQSPDIDPDLPLPVALWARLYAEVAPLLTELGQGGIRLFTFYHQQLRSAVEALYLTDTERIERHRVLAAYFAGQSWRLGPHIWNWRKVDELVTQEEWAGDRAAAEQTLEGLARELEYTRGIDESEAIDALIGRLFEHFLTGGYWRVGERFLRLRLVAYQAHHDQEAESNTLVGLGTLAIKQGRRVEAASYLERALAIQQEVGDRAGQCPTLNNLGELARRQGRPAEAADYFERALTIEQEVGNRTGQGYTLYNLGLLAAEQGRPAEATTCYERALAIQQEVGDRAGQSQTLGGLGALATNQGRPAEAASYYERGLAVAQEVGNRAEQGTILRNLGVLAATQNRFDEAARYYEQALAIAQEVGDRAEQGVTMDRLGSLAADQGRRTEASSYYERALAIQQEVGVRAEQGRTLHNLGVLAAEQDHPAEAAHYLEQALAIRREVGDRAGQAVTLLDLGALGEKKGRFDEATRYYEQALAIAQEVGDRPKEGQTLYNLGNLADKMGRLDEATTCYERALAIQQEVGDRAGQATTLLDLGVLAEGLGHPAETAHYLEQALAIRREVGDRAGQAVILAGLGVLADGLGRPAEGTPYLEQALAIQREVGDRAGQSKTLMVLGQLAAAQARPDEAAAHYERALAIQQEVGDREGQGTTLHNLGALALEQGRLDVAARYLEQALTIHQEVSNESGEATTLSKLGVLAAKQDRAADAVRYLERALAMQRQTGDWPGQGQTLDSLGNLAAKQGRVADAVRYLEQALAVHQQAGDQARQAATLTTLGILASDQGHLDEAARYFEQVPALYHVLGNRDGEATALSNLGSIALDLHRPEEARSYFERVLVIARELGDHEREGGILNDLGLISRSLGKPEEARSYFERALAIAIELGDHERAGGALLNLGVIASEFGQQDTAGYRLVQALAQFEAIGDVAHANIARSALDALVDSRPRRRSWWPMGRGGR
jgi:tetratricopeptide (TPR) repeat protein